MKKKVVFILSSPHSGSTILDLAIGAHSKCLSLGEIVSLDEEIGKDTHCVCGERISCCKFWTQVFRKVRGSRGVDEGDMSPFNLNPVIREDGSKVQKLFEIGGLRKCRGEWANNTKNIFDAALDVSRMEILIDSSKDPIRAIRMVSILQDYECYFIHLVRDVRGVANSCKKDSYHVTLPGDSEPRVLPREDCIPPREGARQWRRFNLIAAILLATRVPRQRRCRVRYEDLCNFPERTLQRLSEWLGLPYEESMRYFGGRIHHNVKGNPSRFNSKEIRPTDETWRTGLSDNELDQCMRRGKVLRRWLGYGRGAENAEVPVAGEIE